MLITIFQCEFEPLISSGIELSGQSIMFTIYSALSDATLITKRNRDEMAGPESDVWRQKMCTNRTWQGYCASPYHTAMESCYGVGL